MFFANSFKFHCLAAVSATVIACAPITPMEAQAGSQPTADVALSPGQWDRLSEQIADSGYSGVAAIVRDGEVVHVMASGLADRERRIPNTADTQFGLASVAKMFTAIGILQLVEQGRVNLDDPVGRFFPDYPNEVIRERATVLDLMKMRSGLRDYFGDQYERDKASLRTLEDFVPLFENEEIAFEPGTGFEYSNAGYILLGLIIERASGEDYYDYMQRNILDVAGMANTGYGQDGVAPANLAIPYRVEGIVDMAESAEDMASGPLVSAIDSEASFGTSAGGGFSTTADFARLDRALRNGQLLSPESIGVLFNEQFVEGTRGAGMAGGAPGVSARYRLLPNGYSIVAFSNTDWPSTITVAGMIEEELE